MFIQYRGAPVRDHAVKPERAWPQGANFLALPETRGLRFSQGRHEMELKNHTTNNNLRPAGIPLLDPEAFGLCLARRLFNLDAVTPQAAAALRALPRSDLARYVALIAAQTPDGLAMAIADAIIEAHPARPLPQGGAV